MQAVFEKIIEKLEEECFLTTNDDGETNELSIKVVDLNDAIEIVKQEAEKFGRDTNVWSKGNDVLEFANLLKELCCKKDEDYDNPVISPKYLNDTIENLLLDFNVEYNNGWIPCSERLPEESGEYLTWVEYDGDRFIAIDEIDCDGIIKEWNCSTDYKIIAWQPLPQPFQKGE